MDCDVVWSEDPTRRPMLLALPRLTRTNRFFAMVHIYRKVCLAQLVEVCARLHPAEFRELAPPTWWVGKAEAAGKDKWPEQLDGLR
eukprot:7376674-Prymnesium_polylepis.1